MYFLVTLNTLNLIYKPIKKLIILLFILGISNSSFSQLKNNQVVGKWKYTVELDDGNMTGELKFSEEDGKLKGVVLPSDGGTYPMTKIELKEGNNLYFELQPDYDVIKVTVKIEDEKFKGTGSTYQGEFALTGEKTRE